MYNVEEPEGPMSLDDEDMIAYHKEYDEWRKGYDKYIHLREKAEKEFLQNGGSYGQLHDFLEAWDAKYYPMDEDMLEANKAFTKTLTKGCFPAICILIAFVFILSLGLYLYFH